jgi:hypothetical protein
MTIIPSMTGPGRLALGVLALGALAAWLPARPDEGPAAAAFIAHTAAGKDLQGALKELKKDWSVRLGEHEVATGKLVSLRRQGRRLPPFPEGDYLILANGDCVPFQSVQLAGERLQLVSPDLDNGKETSLPLASVALLWRSAPERSGDAQRLRRLLLGEKRTSDVVLLRNGDRLAGVLNGLDAQKVTIEVGQKVRSVPLAQVAVAALSTDLAEPLRPKGVYGRLILTDGSRLSVTPPSCAGGPSLEAATAFGARLKVPLDRVAALDVCGGPAVYLSDLKATKYEFTPYLDEHWSYVTDANVVGHDLVLAGSTYSKGIGMHSQSQLSYALDGGYHRFEALVGLDERDGTEGSVRVRVLADGKALDLGADREVTAAAPLAIGVSVEGVRELTLVVEFGRKGNVGDVVNWADARLLR